MHSVGSERNKREVLVIDDSDIALEAIREVLKSSGFTTIGRLSPIGAVNLVAKNDIRVVVTDVNMPQLCGQQLVLLFRNNPKTKHVKVILVSDLPTDELYALGRSARAHGIVQKGRLQIDLVPLVQRLFNDPNFKTGPMSARSIDPRVAFRSVRQKLSE